MGYDTFLGTFAKRYDTIEAFVTHLRENDKLMYLDLDISEMYDILEDQEQYIHLSYTFVIRESYIHHK